MKPYIVRGVMDKDGRIVKEFEPTVVRRVVSPLTAERIASIMTSVVGDEDGTGKNARIVNVSVAGKTGTSQKFDFSSGRYSSRKIVASFIGFFPAEDPQMVVYVMLDEPKKQRWGGVAAAPVFKNISEQVLRCFNSKIEIRETDEEAIDITEVVKADDLEIIPVSTDVVADGHVMPDFRGMSIREVLKISRNMGIKAKITGDGWAVKQKPEPGTPIGKYKSCCVSFGCGFR